MRCTGASVSDTAMKTIHSNNGPNKQNTKKTNSLKKTILSLAIVAGLTLFAGDAKAAVVFQSINQTIFDTETFDFGFDGAAISLGSGPYRFTFNAPRTFPAWSGPGFYYPPFTMPANVRFVSPADPYDYVITGPEGGQGGNSLQVGDSVETTNAGWDNASATWMNTNTINWVALTNRGGSSAYAGWAEFSFNDNAATIGAIAFTTVSRLGDGVTPGDINIGDTGSGYYTASLPPTSSAPEPGQVASSLLLLALGAAGVAIQRQRAKKKLVAAVAKS